MNKKIPKWELNIRSSALRGSKRRLEKDIFWALLFLIVPIGVLFGIALYKHYPLVEAALVVLLVVLFDRIIKIIRIIKKAERLKVEQWKKNK